MDDLLRAAQPLPSTVVTSESIAHLPAPVQRWLTSSGVVGRQPVRTVRLTQRGEMRQRPDGAWIPAVAEQVFSVHPPGFVWRTTMEMPPFIDVLGVDRYADGSGSMRISMFGLVPLVDASGSTIDQGTMLRYLAEICWFPTAALSPAITWTAVDDTSAQATLTDRRVQSWNAGSSRQMRRRTLAVSGSPPVRP
jgi:hypothetical protein